MSCNVAPDTDSWWKRSRQSENLAGPKVRVLPEAQNLANDSGGVARGQRRGLGDPIAEPRVSTLLKALLPLVVRLLGEPEVATRLRDIARRSCVLPEL